MNSSPILGTSSSSTGAAKPNGSAWKGRVAYAFAAVGLVYLVGSLTDLATLWLGQRQPGPNWEFVAASNSLNATPRLGLALGLLIGSAWLAGMKSSWPYRLLGVLFVFTGLAAAMAAALVLTDYFAIVQGGVPQEGARMLRVTTIKAVVIGGLVLLAYGSAGILALRKPRGA